MKTPYAILFAALLSACSTVPYTEDGQIIVPQTANFTMQAQEGPLDFALDELIVKIRPGEEEARGVLLGVAAVAIYCQVRECSGRVRIPNVAVTLPAGTSPADASIARQLNSTVRTEAQIEQLAKLSEAIAIIAERDSAALQEAPSSDDLVSWVSLYKSRLEKLETGRDLIPAIETQLREFLNSSAASRIRPPEMRNFRELQKALVTHHRQITLSIDRITQSIGEMEQGRG